MNDTRCRPSRLCPGGLFPLSSRFAVLTLMGRAKRTCLPAGCLAISVIASAAMADTPNRGAGELPKRASGLWHIQTISESFGTREIDTCIGPDDLIVAPVPGAVCAPYRIERTTEETIVTLECTDNSERQVTSVLLTGDFKTWYRGQSKISMYQVGVEGLPKTVGFTIDARFVSSICPDGSGSTSK